MSFEIENESIKFDEKLSEIVRKHPCLYDKTKKGYKDKNATRNAWVIVARELGVDEGKLHPFACKFSFLIRLLFHCLYMGLNAKPTCISGERAKRLFDNLKKRLNKRRNDLRRAERSGTSSSAVTLAEARLEPYQFLAWLQPYIRTRTTIKNLNVSQSLKNPIPSMSAAPSHEVVVINDVKGEEIAFSNDNDNVSLYTSSNDGGTTPALGVKRKSPIDSDISEVLQKPKWQNNRPNLDNIEVRPLKTMERVSETSKEEEKKDDCDIFGMLVAVELKKLTNYNKMVAKQQIQNLIFQLQMNQEQKEQQQRQQHQQRQQQRLQQQQQQQQKSHK